jgi:protein involved in polysaccharide export with SLBB domain
VSTIAILFLAPPALARANKGCSARHHAAADGTPRTQCRTSASNMFSRPPRITLGVGDVVSVTIFEAEPGGLFVPSEPGATW